MVVLLFGIESIVNNYPKPKLRYSVAHVSLFELGATIFECDVNLSSVMNFQL